LTPKSIALYGGWGMGKTSLLAGLAKYLWTKKGLKTLLYTSDTGGAGPFDPAVAAGAAEVIYTDAYADSQFNMMDLVCRGFKPPAVGAPLKEWVKVDFKASGIAAMMIEGLTSWGQGILDWAAKEHGAGRQVGVMDKDGKLNFKDGDTVYGLSNQGHIYIAQLEIAKKVAQAKRLLSSPTGPELIVWTALETKVELKKDANIGFENKPYAYGPQLPGQAATAKCGSWFTDVLHLDLINQKKVMGSDKVEVITGDRRLFLQPHYAAQDPTPYYAKTSVNPDGKMPASCEPSFQVFLEELEKANQRASAGWDKGGPA
jgi:hypothetical protein